MRPQNAHVMSSQLFGAPVVQSASSCQSLSTKMIVAHSAESWHILYVQVVHPYELQLYVTKLPGARDEYMCVF